MEITTSLFRFLVDEIKLLYSELCSFSQYWTDEFIAWNSSEYGGVETLKFNPSQLWVPDLCIYDG